MLLLKKVVLAFYCKSCAVFCAGSASSDPSAAFLGEEDIKWIASSMKTLSPVVQCVSFVVKAEMAAFIVIKNSMCGHLNGERWSVMKEE